ncbi:MAG: MFS transporter [Chloroflexi bacterium]|nr:MFS transporter [Chloroflexota bacterium]
MRTFLRIWSGQTVSQIGSRMTNFGLTLWIWGQTGKATSVSLMVFFSLLPMVFIAPIAGVLVDRWNRKILMLGSDSVAGLSTVVLLILYLTGHLEIWHLYITSAINMTFSQLQTIAFSASISVLVPPEQYSRVSGLRFITNYGASIIGPAFAGVLYYTVKLPGIMAIDLLTLSIGLSTLAMARIPRAAETEAGRESRQNWWTEISYGFHYLRARPSLLALSLTVVTFWFVHDLGGALYAPLVLARSGDSARTLATVSTAAGLGGVTGAIFMSAWGGGKFRRIHPFLIGTIGAGIAKTIFGFGQSLVVWFPAQIFSSFNFPIRGGAIDSIWMSKVEPDIQGRVFAFNQLLEGILTASATLMAGPLADQVFEPAMRPNGSLSGIFGWLVGTGTGSGIAVIYISMALMMIAIGLVGYMLPAVRNVEKIAPDYTIGENTSSIESQIQIPIVPHMELEVINAFSES